MKKNPYKQTARQGFKLSKMQIRAKDSLGKTITKEVGSTIRNVAGTMAATRGMERISETQLAQQRSQNQNNLEEALKKYNEIINGSPEQEGESGDKSTTNTGGSGSALGG